VQGFESSVNKVFQKEKLVNSKTIDLQSSIKKSVQQELTWFIAHACWKGLPGINSRLLQTFIHDGHKKFITLDPGLTFTSFILRV
jgi:hypothetical protein